jgi:hypothetical protein
MKNVRQVVVSCPVARLGWVCILSKSTPPFYLRAFLTGGDATDFVAKHGDDVRNSEDIRDEEKAAMKAHFLGGGVC